VCAYTARVVLVRVYVSHVVGLGVVSWILLKLKCANAVVVKVVYGRGKTWKMLRAPLSIWNTPNIHRFKWGMVTVTGLLKEYS